MQTLTTTKLMEIFVETDDFLLELHQLIIQHSLAGPKWHSRLSRSETMTILVAYHLSGRKCFNRVAGPYFTAMIFWSTI